jgi:hypothetical protein
MRRRDAGQLLQSPHTLRDVPAQHKLVGIRIPQRDGLHAKRASKPLHVLDTGAHEDVFAKVDIVHARSIRIYSGRRIRSASILAATSWRARGTNS